MSAAANVPTRTDRRALWQTVIITAAAVLAFALMRAMPGSSNLSHGDFTQGPGVVEFCDPSNPQFIPVVAVRSPVRTRLTAVTPPVVGEPTRFVLTLHTATGKPIGPIDLLVAHTRRLHLMAVDPTLRDYHHVHPEPGEIPGEWVFELTPQLAGTYRVFADFMPAATARGLYASAEFQVDGEVAENPTAINHQVERDGYRFTLQSADGVVRARQVADLTFIIERPDGAPVPLGVVMDAYAHLVAFDQDRSGFAHLHPNEADLSRRPDPLKPTLTFKVTIPEPGRYVVWAQVDLDGVERFVPFWFNVVA